MKKSQLPAFDINKVEIGTKVVTRGRHSGKIDSIDLEKLDYPISAIIEVDGKENTLTFTKEGRFYSDDKDSMFDLFLEEEKIENQESIQSEKQDKDEIDNYDPYKATVKSIADMVERYSELQSIEELKDFYNNVKIKCRDAFEYGRVYMINLDKKSDDKPKFKVGDFIINEYCMGKVVEFTDDAYLLDTGQGIPFSCDNTHLWTIQDTKPGDILVNGSNIFILHFIHDSVIVPYCHVNINDGKFYNDFKKHFCLCSIDDVITLATEEQCNLFAQKMKEAGYKWDNKYKELKKINKEDKELKQINKEVKTRLMTNQELSWWLREHPEEHREYHLEGETCVCFNYTYNFENSNEEVDEYIRIRSNGGEWVIPLIEV